jgi:predicted RNA binding protein YcfA (HicA-like mRNA interferase family)
LPLSTVSRFADDQVHMNVRSVIRILKRDGWVQVRMKGSHRQFRHPTKAGLVTVPGKPSDDLAVGTLNSIWKQAGLKS